MVQPALGEVFRSGRAHTVAENEMGDLSQTKLVVHTLAQTVLSNTKFLFSIMEIVNRKLID